MSPLHTNTSDLLARNATVTPDLASIRRIFDRHAADPFECCRIEERVFPALLSELLHVKWSSQMSLAQIWSHWDELCADGDGMVSYDAFLQWYSQKFQVDVTPDFTSFFTEEDLVSEEQLMLRELAKAKNLNIAETEHLWEVWKRIDTDGSGCLDVVEFEEMMRHLLLKESGANNKKSRLPPNMIQVLWGDLAGSEGKVHLEDFVVWYPQYFGGKGADQGGAAVETFYKRVGEGGRRPSFKRGATFSRTAGALCKNSVIGRPRPPTSPEMGRSDTRSLTEGRAGVEGSSSVVKSDAVPTVVDLSVPPGNLGKVVPSVAAQRMKRFKVVAKLTGKISPGASKIGGAERSASAPGGPPTSSARLKTVHAANEGKGEGVKAEGRPFAHTQP